MTVNDLILKQLYNIFEEENVLSDKISLKTYYTDASQIRGNAKYVVFPKQKEQIRRLLVLASKHKQTLVPRGAGTGLVGGAVSDDSIVVDFSRMTSISEFDKIKRSIVVQPGVILEKLNIFLKNYGLFFPVIPSSHTVCTLGGMVATNAAGSRVMKYGKTSDNVLDVELLDALGNTHKIKDASVFGSEGIYGFITKMTLHLEPIPKEQSISIFTIDTLDEMILILEELKENPHVSAIEFIDKESSAMIDFENKYHFIVEYDDLSGDIKNPKEIKEIWNLRDGFRTLYAEKELEIIEDPWLPDDKIKEFIEWTEVHDVPCFGHMGIGVMHVNFNSKQKTLIDKMFKFVIKLGGEVTGEHGIGILKKKYISTDKRNKFMKLKKKYDPKEIINPGKIVGEWKLPLEC